MGWSRIAKPCSVMLRDCGMTHWKIVQVGCGAIMVDSLLVEHFHSHH